MSPSHTIKEVGALFANRDGVLLTDYFFTIREKVNGVPVGRTVDPNFTLSHLRVWPGGVITANFTEEAKARHKLYVDVFDECGEHITTRSLCGTEKFQLFKSDIRRLLNQPRLHYTFWFDDFIIKDLDTPYSVGMYSVDQRPGHIVQFTIKVMANS